MTAAAETGFGFVLVKWTAVLSIDRAVAVFIVVAWIPYLVVPGIPGADVLAEDQAVLIFIQIWQPTAADPGFGLADVLGT